MALSQACFVRDPPTPSLARMPQASPHGPALTSGVRTWWSCISPGPCGSEDCLQDYL